MKINKKVGTESSARGQHSQKLQIEVFIQYIVF